LRSNKGTAIFPFPADSPLDRLNRSRLRPEAHAFARAFDSSPNQRGREFSTRGRLDSTRTPKAKTVVPGVFEL